MDTIHILQGVDHLLFMLALLLIVSGLMPLLKAVTAFTVAHSITLALATLGVVHVPSAPTEAIIAFSNDFMKQLAASFKPNCSAVFVLVRKVTSDKVLDGLSAFKGEGKVLQTSLTKDKEDELRHVIENAA
jgi:hydrogenase/urease accessory protein HupE